MSKPKTFPVYIGLHLAGGKEPPVSLGYRRAEAGETDLWKLPYINNERQFVFPDVQDPGWGEVVGYAAYDRPEGGDPLYIWMLPATVNAQPGTVPVIHKGRLLLGVDVSAQIQLVTPCAAASADVNNGRCCK